MAKSKKNDCVIPRKPKPEELPNLTLPQPKHEVEEIKRYVQIEASGEKVIHLEKVKTEPVLGKKVDVWDVHTDKRRWWVMTNLTSLYDQGQFPSVDFALSFHIGLMIRLSERDSGGTDDHRERVTKVWRLLDQADEALDLADEVEDYQAVGLRCREALLALSAEIVDDHLVPKSVTPPKAGDFQAWAILITEHVYKNSKSKSKRRFLKKISQSTWELVNWLTHAKNTNSSDANIVLGATSTVVGMFTDVLMRKESELPDKCPKCQSYRVGFYYRPDLGIEGDYVHYCEKCSWSNPPEALS